MIRQGTPRVNPFVKAYNIVLLQADSGRSPKEDLTALRVCVLIATSITKANAIEQLVTDVKTKVNAFEQIVTDVNSIGADIIILTETWMKDKHADDGFAISGYICLRKDRVKRCGGGVVAFVKQDLQPTRINVQSTMQHTEDLWFAVILTTRLFINFCACENRCFHSILNNYVQ